MEINWLRASWWEFACLIFMATNGVLAIIGGRYMIRAGIRLIADELEAIERRKLDLMDKAVEAAKVMGVKHG